MPEVAQHVQHRNSVRRQFRCVENTACPGGRIRGVVPVVFTAAPRAPAERLALIIDLLCRGIADQGGRKLLAGPLVILIWGRLKRAIRFRKD